MLKFVPIMPAFCSLLLSSYYSNNFASKIDASLTIIHLHLYKLKPTIKYLLYVRLELKKYFAVDNFLCLFKEAICDYISFFVFYQHICMESKAGLERWAMAHPKFVHDLLNK